MMTVSIRRQRGMALLISLVVLIVVSILGTTAMRSALFQSKISVNAQASQMMFQGAESGIESILQRAIDQVTAGTKPQQAGHIFYEALVSGDVQRVCIQDDGSLTQDTDAVRTMNGGVMTLTYDECPQRTDSPVLITALVTVPPPGLDSALPLEGTSLCGNAGSCYGSTQIYSRSYSTIVGLSGEPQSHVQMWGIISPSASN